MLIGAGRKRLIIPINLSDRFFIEINIVYYERIKEKTRGRGFKSEII